MDTRSQDRPAAPHPAFETVRERELPFGIHAHHLRHRDSGAELLALLSDEPNLSFAVGFQTLPHDDTGVAHILEHMVLAGSERFPLKDPFFEMIKGSVAGFINAFTAPDRTVYPFASENERDYLNLLDVYLDAVFRPRLNAETFQQEAWHLERAGEALRYRGVVFNEMKGVTADPMRALSQAQLTGLFPDTRYRHESGGDPAAIPDLDHQALLAFHRDHYHPSRARFVLHGAVPLEATLERIHAYLDGAPRLDALSPPELQEPFGEPRRVEASYPSDEEQGKAFATVAWALPAAREGWELLELDVLEHVLVGNPGAPLRRALLDSGLGEAFVGGLSTGLRQPVLTAGLRGVVPERAGEVAPLVLETLQRWADEGLDADAVEAALNAIEFDLREMDAYGGQRGIALASEAIGAWLHGRDPLDELDFEPALSHLREHLGDGPAALTSTLRRLLEARHRLEVTVRPDRELLARRDAEERSRLEALRAGMDAADLERVEAQAEALREHQQAPDPPEAVAALPYLRRSDLERDERTVPTEADEVAGVPVRRHGLETGGLLYVDLAFDLRSLPTRLVPYATLLGRALLETGTRRRGVAALSTAIDRDTGGISASPWAASGVEGAGPARMMVRGKTLARRSDALAQLMAEILTEANLDDRERLRGLALEEKSRREAALLPRGHGFAMGRVAAHFGEAQRVGEALQGLEALRFLRRLTRRIDEAWEEVRADLEELRRRLFTRSALVVGLTADGSAGAQLDSALRHLMEALPEGNGVSEGWGFEPLGAREAFPVSAQVHYVAAGWRVGEGRAPGAYLAAVQHLRSNVLVPRIRFQGGAYGAGAQLDPFTGGLTFYSYRDPNLEETLGVYRQSAAELRRARELPEEEWDKLIVGASKGLDGYLLPGARGTRELQRHLRGLDAERRAMLRDELFAAGPADFEALAERLEGAGEPYLAILGGRASLEAARERTGVTLVPGVTGAD